MTRRELLLSTIAGLFAATDRATIAPRLDVVLRAPDGDSYARITEDGIDIFSARGIFVNGERIGRRYKSRGVRLAEAREDGG